ERLRWAFVSLEADRFALEQAELVGGTPVAPFVPPIEQLERRVTEALARGVRGLWFRLPKLAPESQAPFLSAAESLNHQLELWSPWLAAGRLEPALRTNSPTHLMLGWSTSSSRFFLAHRLGDDAETAELEAALCFRLASFRETEDV